MRRSEWQAAGHSQRGVALLAALILMLAVVVTLGNIFYRHQVDVARSTDMFHGEQAQLLALSAENWARQLLSRDPRDVDTHSEDWARALPAMPVDNGFISGCMVDLQARLNLNSFAAYDSAAWEAEMAQEAGTGNGLIRTWLALLRQQELPAGEQQAASIIDWVDSDTRPLNQWGAEQPLYDFERSRRMVANAPLTDIEELAIIRGYDVRMLQTLAPWISALPAPTPVNVNTAPPPVLLALAAEHGQAFVDLVLDQRPFDSLQAFREDMEAGLGLAPNEAGTLWPETLVGVSSDYFQLHVRVSLGVAEVDVSSVLARSGGQDTPVVIRRSLHPVPAIDTSGLNEEELLSLRSPCEQRQLVDSMGEAS